MSNINDETKSLQDANPVKKTPAKQEEKQPAPKKETIAERNMKAALQRAEEEEAERKRQEEEFEKERKNDGRKYDMEVEGFNIGDSLVRRMNTLNEKVAEAQDKMAAEDMEAEVEGIDDTEETSDEEETALFEDESEDIEDEGDYGEDPSFEDEDLEDEDDLDDGDDEPEEILEDKKAAYNEAAKVIDIATKIEEVDDKDAGVEKLSDKPLPDQGETLIDEDDLSDIDLDDDIDDSSEDTSDNDDVSDAEIEKLKEEINAKIGQKLPEAGAIHVVDKPVSVNQLLSRDDTSHKAADWPLMSAGKIVSMKRFSGPEIEDLNRSTNGRNRFNAMKDIYRNIYNHIVSEKPGFEQWLKETSFMDLEHIYMCAYKASFNGANYIPMNCDDDKCDNVFLTDNVDMEESMVKFKDDAAKERFNSIMNGNGKVEPKSATRFVVLTPTIGVTLREPSIYNTIFENSVLDQKFIDKYEKLLTMMVYIDQVFYITNGQARPIAVKKDAHSIAKTAKYRIATYAKVINNLSSDGYSILMSEIAKMNNSGDEVTYQFPEVTCPKCGHTIEASPASAPQLLFSRHRLNLLTAQ